MLQISGVSKRFGDVIALDGVDLVIEPGQVVALLGPNGAGKTTLVSIVAGLLKPTGGRVEVAGVDVQSDPHRARSHLGLAPQDLGIYPTLSGRENLVFFGELAGMRGARLSARVEEVAEVLGITDLLDRPVRFASGGQKRRLHTALALLHRPTVLLLDEPTTGVDVGSRADLLTVVRKIAAEGSAVCYCTHYLNEVEELDASVAILDHGRIIAGGSVAELVGGHAQPALELSFDEAVPSLNGRWRWQHDGNTLRILCDDPAAEAAAVLVELGDATSRLRSIEVVTASLEAVFLQLTGRRYGYGGNGR